MALIGYVFLAYVAVGFLFALAFITKGAGTIDENAKSSGFVFRLLILPASTLLWPYLLRRWLKGAET